MLPQIFLRRFIQPSLVTSSSDPDIVEAVEFVAEKVTLFVAISYVGLFLKIILQLQSHTLRRVDLASRLTINCINSHVNKSKIKHVQTVTIMDVFDDYALGGNVREEIYDYYPKAKIAHLKSGGNYPYLSRFEETNIHLKVSAATTLC